MGICQSQAQKVLDEQCEQRWIKLLNRVIRSSLEYKLWRKAIFERDNYTCIWCGQKENLETDHIQLFSERPDLRFAIDNGRTLCRSCHLKRHNMKVVEEPKTKKPDTRSGEVT